MPSAPEVVLEIIFGRWRSQILYAGAALGVFDHLFEDHSIGVAALASSVGADPDLLYRLLRALAAIGLLTEDNRKGFRLTEIGVLLREEHPNSLKAMALREEGPEHYAAWKHLLPVLREAKPNGFFREFGMPLFEYVRKNPQYGAIFNRAMTDYSLVETEWALTALANEDFSKIHTLCDVGGGHGHLASLLSAYPGLQATVLDMPEVIGETDRLWAPKLGLTQRCRYHGGDMFSEVPSADAYVLKSVLHNWSDDECIRILANLRRAIVGAGRVFIIDFFVPGPEEPHFSKLFDIHMMLVLTGRERTAAEFSKLLAVAGWQYDAWHRVPNAFQSVVAATAI
jgi:ubiquinone/menaquinone biosynthesis C-methylase UbiE